MAEENKRKKMSELLQEIYDKTKSNYVVMPKNVFYNLVEYARTEENFHDEISAFMKGIREGMEKAKTKKENDNETA